MAASAALPGLFFCFSAMILLILVSVSSPTLNSISFLNANQYSFGVFGYTGSKVQVGYYFPLPGDINTGILHNLTFVLILYPIAAGLSGLAFLFGVCGAGYHRVGTVFMSFLAGLATLCTLIVWSISMSLFGTVRSRLRSNGINANWGNANWLALGALVALFLGSCTAACGVFGHYRDRRSRR
ncbi:pali-domain-containing protein [Suillus americanus]|nr:pali-domain-containing protein [Suillus americanus]